MAALRWRYWPEVFAWLDNPLILWSAGMFLFLDLSYGLCYWYILRIGKKEALRQKHLAKSQ